MRLDPSSDGLSSQHGQRPSMRSSSSSSIIMHSADTSTSGHSISNSRSSSIESIEPPVMDGTLPAAPLQQQGAPAAVGELPHSWFLAYPQLRQLRVVGCGAAGTLPPELSAANKLESLVLSRNALQGTLPQHLVHLQVGQGQGQGQGLTVPL
jgi:hypothetical protein